MRDGGGGVLFHSFWKEMTQDFSITTVPFTVAKLSPLSSGCVHVHLADSGWKPAALSSAQE